MFSPPKGRTRQGEKMIVKPNLLADIRLFLEYLKRLNYLFNITDVQVYNTFVLLGKWTNEMAKQHQQFLVDAKSVRDAAEQANAITLDEKDMVVLMKFVERYAS